MIIFKIFIQPAYVCRHIGLPRAGYYVGILGQASAVAFIAVWLPAFFLFKTISDLNLIQMGALAGTQLIIATVAGYFTVFGKDERQTIVRVLLQAIRPHKKAAEFAPQAAKASRHSAKTSSIVYAVRHYVFSHHSDVQPRLAPCRDHRQRARADLHGLRNPRRR